MDIVKAAWAQSISIRNGNPFTLISPTGCNAHKLTPASSGHHVLQEPERRAECTVARAFSVAGRRDADGATAYNVSQGSHELRERPVSRTRARTENGQ